MSLDLDLLLVIDVGNSGTKLGVVRGDDVAGPVRLPRCDGPAVREFAKPLVRDTKPVVVVCGSDSNKAKDLAWELAKVGFPGAVVVDHDHLGLPSEGARSRSQAGVDRRVQALAASHAGAWAPPSSSRGDGADGRRRRGRRRAAGRHDRRRASGSPPGRSRWGPRSCPSWT